MNMCKCGCGRELVILDNSKFLICEDCKLVYVESDGKMIDDLMNLGKVRENKDSNHTRRCKCNHNDLVILDHHQSLVINSICLTCGRIYSYSGKSGMEFIIPDIYDNCYYGTYLYDQSKFEYDKYGFLIKPVPEAELDDSYQKEVNDFTKGVPSELDPMR